MSNNLNEVMPWPYVRVQNNTGSTINQTVCVRILSLTSGHMYPNIQKCGTQDNVDGITIESIADGASGVIQVGGYLQGINTNIFGVSAFLFCDANGNLTSSSPGNQISVARCIVQSSTAGILFLINQSVKINNFGNFVTTANPSRGQLVIFSSNGDETLGENVQVYVSNNDLHIPYLGGNAHSIIWDTSGAWDLGLYANVGQTELILKNSYTGGLGKVGLKAESGVQAEMVSDYIAYMQGDVESFVYSPTLVDVVSDAGLNITAATEFQIRASTLRFYDGGTAVAQSTGWSQSNSTPTKTLDVASATLTDTKNVLATLMQALINLGLIHS